MRSSGRSRHRAGTALSGVWKLIALVAAVFTLIACWHFGQQRSIDAETARNTSAEDVTAETAYLAVTAVDAQVPDHPDQTIALDSIPDGLTITDGKIYALTGKTNTGVRIHAPEQTVRILLDGVDISASEGPCILVEAADRVIITLMPGSQNYLSDASARLDDNDYDGCVYSSCDLTFNGTGSLEVKGLYQDAIRSRDSVKILDGTYRLEAKRTGIRGNDGIHITGGTLYVGSEKNGLLTTKRGADGRGALVISGGELSVVAGRYAFVTEKAPLYIASCRIQTNSVIGDFDVHGTRYIEEGCLQ